MKEIDNILEQIDEFEENYHNVMDSLLRAADEIKRLSAETKAKIDKHYDSYRKEVMGKLAWEPDGSGEYWNALSTHGPTNNFGLGDSERELGDYWKTEERAEKVRALVKSLLSLIHKGHDLTISIHTDKEDVLEPVVSWELGDVTRDLSGRV